MLDQPARRDIRHDLVGAVLAIPAFEAQRERQRLGAFVPGGRPQLGVSETPIAYGGSANGARTPGTNAGLPLVHQHPCEALTQRREQLALAHRHDPLDACPRCVVHAVVAGDRRGLSRIEVLWIWHVARAPVYWSPASG